MTKEQDDQAHVGEPADSTHQATASETDLIPTMLTALKAVIGTGYLENQHPASQDYVSKRAIALVRAAIAKAEGR